MYYWVWVIHRSKKWVTSVTETTKNWIFCQKNGRELTKSFHQNYSQLLLEYCINNIVYFSQKCPFDTKFSQFWWFTHLRRENLSLRFTHIFRNFFWRKSRIRKVFWNMGVFPTWALHLCQFYPWEETDIWSLTILYGRMLI